MFPVKLEKLLLPLGIVAIGAIALYAYNSAVAAPLPKGFPAPTEEGKIEVKRYPAYRAATVRYTGDLSMATFRAFNPLFRHISDNEISMTSPVETRYPTSTLDPDNTDTNGEAWVSFLYRDTDIYPKEIAENIEVEDIPPMTVVSLGLRGSYDYSSYQENIKKLYNWLGENPQYAVVGQPRRFFYDSPFVPETFKRSEIQIPIDKIEETEETQKTPENDP
ncbi:heme-binding protein [Capilliphycus salinus ALCB114379]|uniref:heme-binding protein n=1 Tax=Capilliphycus salinus TaxID=2768948 RepID=UPI0039A64A44